jgi:hypothetical protein
MTDEVDNIGGMKMYKEDENYSIPISRPSSFFFIEKVKVRNVRIYDE